MAWGHPTFRVRDKIFTSISGWYYGPDGKPLGDGDTSGLHRTTLTMPTLPGEQEALLSRGHPFFRPAYVGGRGWIGIDLEDNTDWGEVEDLVDAAYRKIAPKKLWAQLDETD